MIAGRALALLALGLGACAGETPYRVIAPVPTEATPHATGCQGGCSLVRHKEDELTPAQIDALLRELDGRPVGEESLALDTVLFHDAEVRRRLASPDVPAISLAWRAWLDRELARQIAYFSLRITDERGRVRAQVPETAMALGSKLHMQVNDGDGTGPFNANGTVVRVGRDHLWIRM